MTHSGGLPITTPVFTAPADGLVPAAPGCWVTPDTLALCSFPEHYHFLQVLASIQRYPEGFVAGLSALILRRIPVPHGSRVVTLLHRKRHGTTRDGSIHFHSVGATSIRWATKVKGATTILCVRPDYALLDALRWSVHSLPDAVALVDSVLRHTHFTLSDLQDAYARQKAVAHRHAHPLIDRALALAVPGVDSIRESQLRMRLYALGFPPPLVHPLISDTDGYTALGTPDLYYPDARVALEYDGAGKFQGDFGVLPADSLTLHHVRADRLATVGVHVIHLNNARFAAGSWADDVTRALDDPRGPLPEYQVSGGIPAWETKRGPRWKLSGY
ncbi:MAG: hypothetical protein SPI77_05565 [Corynebacterium sp.]|nr:hypothetical protein [Corynebacterium sp.]